MGLCEYEVSFFLHGLCASKALRCMICTDLVCGLPRFAGVQGLNFCEMLHLQKLAHQHRTFEILMSAAQTCA